MAAYTARITRVVDHGQETRSLFLERPAGLDFLPGQFLSCQLPIDGTRVTKPYTVASSPDVPGDLELLFNRLPGGVASHYLFERRAGDRLAPHSSGCDEVSASWPSASSRPWSGG